MHTSAKSHGDSRRLDLSRIAQDLQIKKVLVENVVLLLDEENTIPFIARYRKERTGGLDEEILRTIQDRLRQLRKLADRKQTILKSLQLNKLLTPELEAVILAADHPKRLEDLYLPFKKKDKATRADKARSRGLTGLADAVWYADPVASNLAELTPTLVNPEKELNTPEDVLAGMQDILAERIAEAADVRDIVRRVMWDTGRITTTRNASLAEGQGVEYKGYFQFTEPLRYIPAHRVLAINRGEKEGALQVKIDWDAATGLRAASDRLPLPPEGTPVPPPAAPPAETASSSPAGEAVAEAAPTPPPADAAAVSSAGAEMAEAAPLPPGESSCALPTTESAPSMIAPAVVRETLEAAGPMLEMNAAPAEATAAVTATVAPAPGDAPMPADVAPGNEVVAAVKVSQEAVPTAAEAAPVVEVGVPAPEATGAGEHSAEAPSSLATEGEAARGPQSRGRSGRPLLRRRLLASHPHAELLARITEDALTRLLVPSLEREVRRELTSRAEVHAVSVFARNLRSKLLAPPLRGRRVLAIDPAFRTGCKLAVLDEIGNPIADAVIYPHQPQNKRAAAKAALEELIRTHQVSVIAIGNGTACRETEEIVAELLAELPGRAKDGEAVGPQTADTAHAAPDNQPPGSEPIPSATELPLAAPSPLASPADPGHGEPAPTAEPEAGAVAAPAADVQPAATPVAENAPPVSTGVEVPAAPVAVDAAETTVGAPEAPAAATAVAVATAKPAAPAADAPLPSLDHLPPAPADLAYIIVNEAGASVYSASPVGREEFPKLDVTLRGTISIGRRLQDPLSELVKIDPQHIGVGLYQHDVHLKQLRESLDAVVESCVNTVGVDVNTASIPLLRHVSGLNQLVARDLVEYRRQNGPFRSREQLKEVPNLGERRFTQAAGFLKILDGSDPLDRTWVHPESYHLARQVLADLGYGTETLAEKERLPELQEKLKTVSPEEISRRLEAGVPTVRDILAALARPGRDPREDLPAPVFKRGVLKIEDLQPGMEMQGTVLNVVDFGAFVDVGLKESGLVHISQMANRFVKNPHEIVTVGDVVIVWVMKVDAERHHVSLTMLKPGTERRAPEKKPLPGRAAATEAKEQPAQEARRPEGRGDRPARGGRPPRGGERQPAGRGQRPQGREGGRTPPPEAAKHALPPRGSRRQDLNVRGRKPVVKPAEAAKPAAQQSAPPPARKPQRKPTPKPKLSQAALTGREALNTFGELAAFWEARSKQAEPAAETPAAAPTTQEEPPPAN